jgi:hypothetical protein
MHLRPPATQGLLVFFGVACLAIGAWGIYSVPRDLAGQAWAVVDDVKVSHASGC